MLATLKTRCGCIKRIEITFPPNPRIVLPLAPEYKFSLYAKQDFSKPTMRVREFELTDYYGGPNGYADYLERWQD